MTDRLRSSKLREAGLFYLGREIDPDTKARSDTPLLYDSSDLVTHAVIAGMTGSGKTGLGIDLIEEAAIDGMPVIAIDPKGDLGNLLLTFPRLAPADFAPWVDADEARRAGQTPEAFAAAEAAKWSKGLAEWGQDGARIERLRAAAEFALYTPGSTVGPAALDREVVRGARSGNHERRGSAAGSRRDRGHERAHAGRRRRRADAQPRAHADRRRCSPRAGAPAAISICRR